VSDQGRELKRPDIPDWAHVPIGDLLEGLSKCLLFVLEVGEMLQAKLSEIDQPDIATYGELSEELGIPISWFNKRSADNTLPGKLQFGRYVRVDRKEFYAAAKRGEIEGYRSGTKPR
jgi:hypothetical protein